MLSIGLLLCFTVASAKPVRPPAPPDFSKLKDESIKKWSGAEVLVVGKIVQAVAGPVGLSNPPLRTYRIQISADKMLRGPAKLDKQIAASYSVRQQKEPTFPTPDKDSLIALTFVRDAWVLQSIDEVNAVNVEQATMATSFPLGWTIKDGKLVSPWASVGKPAQASGVVCFVTGRPVLVAGDVRFSVEAMPPAKVIKFGNPDGDGEYKLIVKNDTANEIEVPALLTDGKNIRWNESIVIRCQNKTYPIPGSTGDVAGLKPVVLKPGESVTGTTHALALQGPDWPKGGYRIEFQFCLAERSATHSLYYLSKHHDVIRDAVQKGAKK